MIMSLTTLLNINGFTNQLVIASFSYLFLCNECV